MKVTLAAVKVWAEFDALVKALLAQVTAVDLGGVVGSTAPRLGRAHGRPKTIQLCLRGFGQDTSMGLSTVLYGATASTLDGLVQVEADLVEASPIGDAGIPIAGNALTMRESGEFDLLGVACLRIETLPGKTATGSPNRGLRSGRHRCATTWILNRSRSPSRGCGWRPCSIC